MFLEKTTKKKKKKINRKCRQQSIVKPHFFISTILLSYVRVSNFHGKTIFHVIFVNFQVMQRK